MPGNRISVRPMINPKSVLLQGTKLHESRGHAVWRRLSWVCVLVLFAQAGIAADGSADPKRYVADVKALSAPSMEGRGAGTQGIARAMHLIEGRYRSLGLQPAGTHSSYLQSFTVITGAKLKEGNRLDVQNGSNKKSLKLNQDFVPFSFSSSAEVSGPVVFAGYGASA